MYFEELTKNLIHSLSRTSLINGKDVGTAVCNLSFSNGINYWEFYCPFNCEGLKFGICKAQNQNQHLFEFKTSTPRIIGVLLNMEDKTLKFYLNGNISQKGQDNLDDGPWYPCVQLSTEGNQCILNPNIINRKQHDFALYPIQIPDLKIQQIVQEESQYYINDNQLRLTEDSIILQRNCIYEFVRLSEQEFYILLFDTPWQYIKESTLLLEKITNIKRDKNFVYLNIEEQDQAILYQILKYLRQNISQLESEFEEIKNGPNIVESQQKEDLLITQHMELLQKANPKPQKKEKIEKQISSTISVTMSRQIETIIGKIFDQLNVDSTDLISGKYRLKTFVDHPQQNDVVWMVEHGYYLQAGFSPQYGFYTNPQLNQLLEINSNYNTQLILKSKIQKDGELIKSKSSRYLATRKDQVVTIYNAEFELFKVCEIDLKQLGQKRQIKKANPIEKKESICDIYKILENYLSIETQQIMQYDEKLLSQLLELGYEQKQSKDALIQFNNDLEQAIDLLSHSQTWQCQMCTLVNSDSQSQCEVCENPRPEQELIIQQIAQPIDKVNGQRDKQQDDEDQLITEFVNEIEEKNNLQHLLFIHVQGNLAPIIFLSVFQNSIVIQRYQHDPQYLNTFYTFNDEGVYCNLTNQWTRDRNNYLGLVLNNSSSCQIVETLAPLYSKDANKYGFVQYDNNIINLGIKVQQIDYTYEENNIQIIILTDSEVYIYKLDDTLQLIKLKQIPVLNVTYLVSNGKQSLLYGQYQVYRLDHIQAQLEVLNINAIQQAYSQNDDIIIKTQTEQLYLSQLILQNNEQEQISLDYLQRLEQQINQEEVLIYLTPYNDKVQLKQQINQSVINLKIQATFENLKLINKEFNHPIPTNQLKITNPEKLELTVHSYNGASFSNFTHVTSMLFDKQKPFTSNYAQTYFIFRSQYANQMLVSHLVIKSELTNQQRGFPIGAGLIFISQSLNELNHTSVFDNMQQEEYIKWKQYRSQLPIPLQEWEPVGYFEYFDKDIEVKCELEVIRPCQYILLKPTNFRKQPFDQTSHFKQNPIEITQVIAYGKTTNEKYQYQPNYYLKGENSILLGEIKKRLSIYSENQLIDYNNVNVYESLVQATQKARFMFQLQKEMELPNNGVLQFELSIISDNITVEINPIQSEWKLINLEIKGLKCGSNKFNFIKKLDHLSKEVKEVLLDPKKFDNLNKKLLDIVYQNDLPKRNTALKILNVAQRNPEVQRQIAEQINLHLFIITNIIQNEINAPLFEFLLYLQKSPKFYETFAIAAEQILNKIEKIVITEAGLEQFIELIKQTIQFSSNQLGQICLESLHQALIKLASLQSKKIMVPYLFSTKYIIKRGLQEYIDEPIQNFQLNELKPLLCKKDPISQIAFHQGQKQIRVFQIDLLGEFVLNKLQLRFQQSVQAQSFRVQVWANQKLQIDQYFQEWTFVQFSQFSYQSGSANNCLHIPVDFTARQLTVQITFQGENLNIKPLRISQIPQQSFVILPEVYGKLLNPYPKRSQQYDEEFQFKQTTLFGDTIYYIYQSENYHILDSYNIFQKSYQIDEYYIVMDQREVVKKNIQFLENAIQSMQQELVVKQNAGIPTSQLQGLIESTLQELHRVQPPRNYENNYNFLYSFSISIFNLLIDTHMYIKEDQALALSNIIINLGDQGHLGEFGINFIKYKLQNFVTEKRWIEFILDQYRKLLNSDNHAQLFQSLNQLNIPINESLKFLKSQKNQEIQTFIFNLLRNKIETKVSDPFSVNDSNKDNLEIAINFLTDDPEFRLGLVQKLIPQCSGQQIKEVLSEQLLNKLTQSGFNNLQKFRQLLDIISNPKQLHQKYLDWSALQQFSEADRETINKEKENLLYNTKFILYFYQSVLEKEIQNIQIDRLLVLFDFLSSCVNRLNKYTRQIDRKQKKKQIQTESEFDDFLNRSTHQVCSAHTVVKLLTLIQSSQDFMVWSRVLKVIQLMNPLQIIDDQIYYQIIKAYKVIKHNNLIYNELLKFTNNLLSTEIYKNSTISHVINVLANHLEDDQLSDLFINVHYKAIGIRIKDIHHLLKISSQYLMKVLNVGGKDGVQGASLKMLSNLEVGAALIKTILQSEKTEPQLYRIEQLDQEIDLLIQWQILNGSDYYQGSPSLNLHKQISEDVDSVIDIISQSQASKVLTILFKNHSATQRIVNQKFINQSISTYTTVQLVQQSSEYLKTKFDELLTNDEIAQKLAIDSNAFTYLIQQIIEYSSDHLRNNIQNDMKEDEFFQSKFKIVQLPGQQTISVNDWASNKKGVKSRLALINLPAQSRNEYYLVFQYENDVELKNVRIGFQTHTNDFNDKVLGVPTSVILEVGQSLEEMYPVSEMDIINDETFSNFQVKVFSYNAQIPLNDQMIPESKPIKYIGFRIRNPVVQMIEGLVNWASKNYKKLVLGINFISAMGFERQSNKLELIHQIQEKTSLDIICKLCKLNFTETLRCISNNQEIIRLIQQSFPKLMKSLTLYNQQLSPLILAVCKYNQEVGDWIIDKLLTSNAELHHAKLLSQIILSNQNQVQRLLKLHAFLLPQLLALQLSNKSDILHFQKLTFFIDSYCNIIQILAKNSDGKQREFDLPSTKDDIIYLIELYELVKTNNFNTILIKLIVTLTYLPPPFITLNQQDIEQILVFTWNKSDLTPYYLDLLQPLIIGSSLSTQWITQQLSQIVQKLITTLNQKLEKQQLLQIKLLICFLNTIAQMDQCRKALEKEIIPIYKAFIDQDYQISKRLIKQLDDQTIIYFRLFFSTLLQNPENYFLVEELIQDVKKLNNFQDMKFIQLFLVPLLNSEDKINLCFSFKSGQQYINDPRQVASQVKQGDISQMILPKETPIFQSNFLTLDQMGFLCKELKLHSWERVCLQKSDGDSSILPTLEDKFLTQSPNMIIIQYFKHGQESILGIVNYGQITKQKRHNTDTLFTIQGQDDTLLFLFKNQKEQFFRPGIEFQATLDIYDQQGTFIFEISSQAFLMIEYVDGEQTKFHLHFEDEKNTAFTAEQINIEYFVYKKQQQQIPKQNLMTLSALQLQGGSNYMPQTLGYGEINSLLLPQEFYDSSSPLNYFRPTPIYQIPSGLQVKDLSQMVQISQYKLLENQTIFVDEKPLNQFHKDELGIIDYDIDSVKLLEEINFQQTKQQKPIKQQGQMRIFTIFENKDGVKAIVEVVRNSIKLWKNQQRAQAWLLFVDELWSFCFLPTFFNQFMKNQLCVNLLFDLLAGVPDTADLAKVKKWEEEEQTAVKFIYQTLVNVFLSINTPEVRVIALEKNLIQHILDRIALVSKENKRQFQEFVQEEKVVQPLVITKKPVVQDVVGKKKGIGYGSDTQGNNNKWNTQEYVEKKSQKSQQLIHLLGIVESFFDFQHWHPSDQLLSKLKNTLFESALLPLLESSFRSGSQLEISKEHDLYSSYLKIVKSMSKHRVLAPIFMKIPPQYVPKQTQSLQELLQTLSENSQVFLNCIDNNTSKLKQEDIQSQKMAQQIIDTYNSVEAAINKFESGQSDSDQPQNEQDQELAAQQLIQEILKKDLFDSYRLLLQDLRFAYIDMKHNGRYKHHYQQSIQSDHNPSQQKIVRLAQEFADMSLSLPIDHTNAIFVRADKERVDVIKAMIMGSKGTPYAHGAFVFDIMVDDSYPNGPPKMNLATTGNGKVRFNPNLYSCGKVCLSLLGTWRGHASENWDPKLSTLLQVLVSTQAIIMSEEVYFNEPGFEQEAGTEEGRRKNEAYSNIVRYSNIKFAMIDQIRDPPKGFETIIRRHFYLKKQEILEECNKWIEYAEQREASYSGLINDHNSSWCAEFKRTPYKKKLQEAVKELEIELNKLQPPSAKDLEGSKILKTHIKNQPKTKNIKEGMANLEEIDVSYDLNQQQKQLTINDENVIDRWSRYIGAMGMDAVKKQSNSSVFLSGLGPLGVEIAKNVILSGVKQFTIHDDQLTTRFDLNGQFFLTEQDIGKNRAEQTLVKLQQLNNYVKISQLNTQLALPQDISEIEEHFSALKEYDLIIIAQHKDNKVIESWSKFARQYKIKLIVCSVNGVFGRIINDFGSEFIVEDKNGEQAVELVIKSITKDGVITLIGKHDFEDSDRILIDNVVGMDFEGKSINKTLHKVKVLNKNEFSIGDLSNYSDYIRNGTVKLVKQPIKVEFQPIHEILFSENPKFDENMSQSDFLKISHMKWIHQFYTQQEEDLVFESEQQEKLYQQFKTTYDYQEFPPLSAYLGGFVSQEAIKAITNKFMPINQIFYTDCVEILPEKLEKPDSQFSRSLERFLGQEVAQKIERSKIFMIGCGAIGCELLKNFAMINLGVNGSMTITDPDHIEVSNLNRQFLFREKHIRKPKSQTAAAAILQMNPFYKDKIIARLDKVFEGTENIFSDQFFEEQTLVANALDNVAARRYVDRRCIQSKVPLLESGTLGPKGHVQCIIPYKTESYGSQNDPAEEGDIPYCTLKMFPEETFHCVEFARDKFSKLFTIRPKNITKIIDPGFKPTSDDIKILRESIKLLQNIPNNYEDCIAWARRKFQKYFVNDIKQLMHTYPLDAKNKDGNLFWTFPKRPPQEIIYNPQDKLHTQFISTLAFLRAKLFGIKSVPDWRAQDKRQIVSEEGAKVIVQEWAPNESKSKNITAQVQKNDTKLEQTENENPQTNEEELEQLYSQFNQLLPKLQKIVPDEFEKDNDQNGHIDFIHAFGNLRAANYKLEEMDWLTVKIKAGRIVPALATTTSVVAALQTIEIIKAIKQNPIDQMKNAFVNLAIPYVQLTEPGAVPKVQLTEQLAVTLWDRWEIEINNKVTLQDLFSQLYQQYKLIPKDLFVKSSPIYMDVMYKKREDANKILNSRLFDLLNLEGSKYIDVTINFTLTEESNDIIKGTPPVRIRII